MLSPPGCDGWLRPAIIYRLRYIATGPKPLTVCYLYINPTFNRNLYNYIRQGYTVFTFVCLCVCEHTDCILADGRHDVIAARDITVTFLYISPKTPLRSRT